MKLVKPLFISALGLALLTACTQEPPKPPEDLKAKAKAELFKEIGIDENSTAPAPSAAGAAAGTLKIPDVPTVPPALPATDAAGVTE